MNNIIMKIMNRILPSCKEVSQLTSQAMDESLPWKKRMELRMHLRMCLWCRRNAEQLQLMRNFAKDHAEIQNEQSKLSSDARDRIANFLEQNDEQS